MTETEWVLLDNPAFEGKTPRVLVAQCHDRTPFITIVCNCGGEMHLHESQTDPIPEDAEIAAPCKTCGKPLVFPPGYFASAFQTMRDDGWIE
jgi:hypothetical protein